MMELPLQVPLQVTFVCILLKAGLPLLPIDEIVERLDAVTRQDLAALAHEFYAPDRMSVAGIAPSASLVDAAADALQRGTGIPSL